MTLPISRNTTYAPGSQVRSADLNAIQDQIVALTQPHRRHIPPCSGANSIGSGIFGNAGAWQSAAGTDLLTVPLMVNEGERITRVDVRLNPNGATAMTCTLRRHNEDGSTTNVTSQNSDTSGNLQTVSITGLSELAGTAINHWTIDIDAGQALDLVNSILLTVDRPAAL